MVHLHYHSTYSFLDGLGLPKDIVKKASELKQKAIAVTDHGNTSSWVQWSLACKENGIKPIYGCEFYICDDIKKQTQKKNHITILAKNLEGYKNILRMTTIAWSEGFYYKPTIDWNVLKKHKEGLIATSGCIGSKVGMMIRNHRKDEDIIKEISTEESIFEEYYIELAPMKFPEGNEAMNRLISLTKGKGYKYIAAGDCHYINQSDSKLHEVLLAIQSGAKWEDPKRWKFDQDDFYLKSEEEMIRDMVECFPKHKALVTQSVKQTDILAKGVEEFELPKAKNMRFLFDGTKEQKASYMLKLTETGLKKRFEGKEIPKQYTDRMNYEFKLIVEKDYIDYFLIIADLINWAKNEDILVGAARGSSAGSVVCWAMKITEVDPLKYGLLFERFIDVNRTDLPDIDIDFQDNRRGDIKRYLEAKYGKSKVAGIATFMKFKGKLCVKDIARVFSIPPSVIETLRPLFVERSGGDSRASFTIHDAFEEFDVAKDILKQYPELRYAEEMEGQIRQYSSHAAGVVISEEALENFVAVYERNDERAISLEKHDAEEIGLLKIDILGLNTLTMVKRAQELIEERHGKKIEFYDLPLDDPKVYKSFQDGKMFGIFQFEGESVYSITRQVNPENFKHLSDIMALARPGPLHAGGTQKYIDRKNSGKKWKEIHPLIEEMTKSTYGVIVYQEQVMRIVREIGGFSWADTSAIRKAMSGRLGTEFFNRYKKNFDKGASAQGLKQEQIDGIWSSICTYGSWCMNLSHTISYSLLSYWTMWIKVNYPIEFYASLFETTTSDDKVKKTLKEYRNEGFKVYDPDVNYSKAHFSIFKEGVIIGLSDVIGIGEKVGEKIASNQPYKTSSELPISKSGLEKLSRIGALRSIEGITDRNLSLFETGKKLGWERPEDSELREVCPAMVPFIISEQLKEKIAKRMQSPITPLSVITDQEDISEAYVAGVISNRNLKDINEVSASHGQEGKKELKNPELVKYVNFILDDDSGSILITVSRFAYPHLQELMWNTKENSDILIVCGRIRKGIRKIYATKIFNFTKDKISKVPPRKTYRRPTPFTE